MDSRNEFNGENVDIETLAALTHLNEMLESNGETTPLQEAQLTKTNGIGLNGLYETAKTYFGSPGEIDKIDAQLTSKQTGLTLLFWAIACFQDEEAIASLIKQEKKSLDQVYCVNGKNIKPLFYAMSIQNMAAIKAIVTADPNIVFQQEVNSDNAANANDTPPPLSALQLAHRQSNELRDTYTDLKRSHDALVKVNPEHLASIELLLQKKQLEAADAIVSYFIRCNANLNTQFRVAADLLQYIKRRESKPEHITDNSIFGKSTIVTSIFTKVAQLGDYIGVPILYKSDQKIDACRQLLANIIKGAKNPLQIMPEAQQNILEQGTLKDIIAPLKLAPEPSEQPRLGITSL